MRKFLLMAMTAVAVLTAYAQNVQLHYDFGRNLYPDQEAGRQKVTLTLEQFKADKWGSWYYFVDVDLSRKETKGAYTEISREFKLSQQSPFSLHVEYDGGLGSRLAGTTSGSYQQSGLAGFAYNGHNSDFSTTWSVKLLYKAFFKDANANSAYHSAQLTGVWGTTFANKKCTFSGFIDFWRGEKANGHGQLVILSEPQFWFNATEHFSIGTECEISNNFIYNTYDDQTFFVNPTIGIKWNF
jgi:hypothetical protein